RQDRCEAPLATAATVITSEIAGLVEKALDVRTDLPWAEWSTDTIAQWDSLGQIAIATAVFDRYGMTVSAGDFFRLRSLQDIASLVSNHRSLASRIEDAKLAIPRDIEFLPLLDTGEATRSLATHLHAQELPGRRLRVAIAATFVAQPMATALT